MVGYCLKIIAETGLEIEIQIVNTIMVLIIIDIIVMLLYDRIG